MLAAMMLAIEPGRLSRLAPSSAAGSTGSYSVADLREQTKWRADVMKLTVAQREHLLGKKVVVAKSRSPPSASKSTASSPRPVSPRLLYALYPEHLAEAWRCCSATVWTATAPALVRRRRLGVIPFLPPLSWLRGSPGCRAARALESDLVLEVVPVAAAHSGCTATAMQG